MTITKQAPKRKRVRTTVARRARGPRRALRVGNLTLDEFREMMIEIIDTRLAELADPDTGLELRPEIIDSIQRQRAEYAAGKRGKPLAEVAARLGLE